MDILNKNECDLPTWENALFVVDNSMWGEKITLYRESNNSDTQVKLLTILSDVRCRIESEIIKREIEYDI